MANLGAYRDFLSGTGHRVAENKLKHSRSTQRRQSLRRLIVEELESRRLLAVAELVEDSVPLRGLNNDISASSGPSAIVEVAGTGYFSASDGTATRLWRLGSSGPVQEVLPDPSMFPANTRLSGSPPQLVNGKLSFFGSTTSVGTQLWQVNSSGFAEVIDDAVPGIGLASGFNGTPTTPVNVGGTLYFSANDGTNGIELWRWNPVSNLIEMVEEATPGGGINPGANSSNPSDLVDANGTLYFLANDGSSGTELWRVHGVTGLAEIVEDGPLLDGGIRPGSASSSPDNFSNVNGTLFFTANDGTNGTELWRIDENGIAVMIEDSVAGGGINPGLASSVSSFPAQLFNASGKLFFVADDGTTGSELWTLNASNVALRVNAVGGGEINPGVASSSPTNFALSNGTLYFSATSATVGTELWRITSTGEAEVVEDSIGGDGGINAGVASTFPANLNHLQGTLYFLATQSSTGQELWRVNSAGIAELVEDAVPGGGIAPSTAGSAPRGMIDVNGTIYFGATDGVNGRELWRINSSGTAEMIEDTVPGGGIRPGASGFLTLSNGAVPVSYASGTVYFIANDGTNGLELWRINSADKAEIVDDAAPGTGIAPGLDSSMRQITTPTSNGAIALSADAFQVYQNTLYFRASNSVDGEELWRVNAAGIAEMIEDVLPGNGLNPVPASSTPGRFTQVNNTLYFVATDEARGDELWRVNSAGVAELVEDAVPGEGIRPDFTGAQPRQLTNANGTLFFSAIDGTNGTELWFVPSSGIAQMVEDSVAGGGISAGSGSSIFSYLDLSSSLLTSSTNPYVEVVEVNGVFYFRAQRSLTEGTELWRMTSSGIASIVDAPSTGTGINPTSVSSGHANPINLINANGTLYFSAYDGANGIELWRVNSSGVAELVEDSVAGNGLNATPGSFGSPAMGGSLPDNFFNFNGTLYFTAYTDATGREVWRINSSGIAEMVEDAIPGGGINPGVANGAQSANLPGTSLTQPPIKRSIFTESNGTLYFLANDGTNGLELWKINSSGMAVMVDDGDPSVGLNPGVAGSMRTSTANSLTNVAGTLYFPANDGLNGFELWRVNSTGLAQRVTKQDGSEINPGTSDSFVAPLPSDESPQFVNANGTLYFLATNSDNGNELWRVNSLGHAELVEDAVPGGGIRPGANGSNPSRLQVAANTVFFAANDGTNGNELWRVNASGVAQMIENSIPSGGIRPGASSSVGTLTPTTGALNSNLLVAEANGTVYFNANDGTNGVELWRLVPNIAPTDMSLSSNQIAEQQGSGAVVGSFATIDGNVAELFTYSLAPGIGGDDNSAFTISGNTLVAVTNLDYATKSSYGVRVRSTDADGAFVEKQFTVNVTDVLPKITDIIASGSAWNSALIDAVDGGGVGTGNGLGYSLNSGVTIPNAGINRIYLQFNEPVIGFNVSTFALLGVNVADYSSIPGLLTVSYDAVNQRGLIELSSPIVKDKLRIGVSDTVVDASMNALDGDENAIAGGVLNFRFNVLLGDSNNDGAVNGGDLPAFATSFNKSAGNIAFNARADWNSDGSVNGGDLPIFAANFNQSLPSAEPGALTFPPPPPAFDSEEDSWSTPMIDEDDIDEFFSQLDSEDELLPLE